jgi:CRISPR-associated protein Csm2
MTDFRGAFRKAGIKESGGEKMKKTCRICKEPLKDDKYDTCYKCSQKSKAPYESLPPEYLTTLPQGYFDADGHLWEGFITKLASDVAKSFGTRLKNHQLRRFYGHAKAAENRLKMTNDWEAVNVDVKRLEPYVSEAKGKDKIPQSFYDFMEKNIKAIKNQKDFEDGFIKHFEAVVAYFTYHYPKS